MWDDKRSKRIVIVAHCVLNQNAKLDRCAHYPGALTEVMSALLESGAGVIQMPCPELLCLGLDRGAERGTNPSVAEEDSRIASRMARPEARAICRRAVADLIYQIDEYGRNGFEILGLVGINGSPTCGVESTWSQGQDREGPGVFIRLLIEGLGPRALPLRMRGIRASQPAKAVAAVMGLLGK